MSLLGCHAIFYLISQSQQNIILNHWHSSVQTEQPYTCLNHFITTVTSAHNLGILFDNHLTFNDQIKALSKSCFYHIFVVFGILLTINQSTESVRKVT